MRKRVLQCRRRNADRCQLPVGPRIPMPLHRDPVLQVLRPTAPADCEVPIRRQKDSFVVTFAILAVHQHGPTGGGGRAAAYAGARVHSRMPDTAIRRLAGVLVSAIAVRCLWAGLS